MFCLLVVLAVVGILYKIIDYWYRKPFLDDAAKKRVFITGTDTGFGQLLAIHLDALGVKVYAGCYTQGGAEQLRQAASSRMFVFILDVSKVDSIKRAREIIEGDLPPGEGLWGIVNNAGIHRGFLLGLTTREDFRDVFDVNFFGTVNVNEIFAPLVKRTQGRIINIISIGGRLSGPAEAYSSSKAALIPYTDGLRRWMKQFNVHVAALEPGMHRTEITNISFLEGDVTRCYEKLSDDLKEEYGEEFVPNLKKDIAKNIANLPLSGFNKVQTVIATMTHALLSKHPKIRYAIGWDVLVYKTVAYLPDYLFDAIILNNLLPSIKLIGKNVRKLRALKKLQQTKLLKSIF